MMKSKTAVQTFIADTGGWAAAQLEACTRCGMCAEACHFYQSTGNPEYAPVWKIELLRRAYDQRFTLAGRVKAALGLDRRVTDADISRWSAIDYEACTICNKCALACPMGIDLASLIYAVREGLSAAEAVPADLMDAVKKQVAEGSPLGVSDTVFDERMEWISDEWEIKLPMDQPGADTLVVFTSIEIMKFPGNIPAIARILNAAGEKWTMSHKGRESVNFGFFEGSPERTVLFLHRVFDAARELGVKRILVTECGHAYDALRWTAANIMEVPKGIAVTHIAGEMWEYIRSGRIKVRPGAFDDGGIVTFHDACKIQRRGGHIREPREVLKILAPNAFREMIPNREQAICCGGGGGVIVIKEADPNRYAAFELKINQLKANQAKTVAMSCSNCRLQFADCVAHFGLDVKVAGLSQMVAEALEE
jgi:Fe-S oxidoreductase